MASRRQFILQGLGLGASFGLAGCQTMERIFGPDRANYDEEVVIIGAGAAGLAAAYGLKKVGRPFRVFDGADRIGGRVRTVTPWGVEGQFVELGAEFINGRHMNVLRLCRELNLTVDRIEDRSNLERQWVFSQGRWVSQQVLLKELQPALQRLARRRLSVVGDDGGVLDGASIRELDSVSAAQVFDDLGPLLTPRGRAHLDQICLSQFGIESDVQSSLAFIMSLDPEERSPQYWRVRGGNGTLLRTLYERVSGVMPDFLVRLRHRCVGLREERGRFEIRFRTAQGFRTVRAERVIMALPPPQIRKIDGWKNLKWTDEARAAIEGWKLAPQTRTFLGFRSRFWQERRLEVAPSRGALMGGGLVHSAWDSSRGQPGANGILTVTTSGRVGRDLGADAPEAILGELGSIWKKSRTDHDGRRLMMNWARHPGIEGAVTYFGPGEFARWRGLFNRETYYDGRLVVVGEHASLTTGTLEGAIETGLRASSVLA